MKTRHGWTVNGLFEHQDVIHGLVYNPYLKDWFHMWWNAEGKCLTHGADSRYDLIPVSVQAA